MHLYDTLTQTLLPFHPSADEVSIYVCGITPYDTTHLGHAFTYTAFDTLIRYLEYQGYGVRYVQNVTDIDDDILRKAGEEGEDWLAQKPGEPAWESPWGPGRPGWHIECSTLSTRLLGETIDIHGGGGDLIFPHHECEIAQIEPVTHRPFVRFWLHAAMVYHEGEKMSKSLGNLVMIRDLLQTYSPDALRLYLASHHYRSSWSFDEAALIDAERLAGRLKDAVTSPPGDHPALDFLPSQERFLNAMADDLDTPTAVTVLDQFAGDILVAADAGCDVRQAQTALRELSTILGLRLDAGGPEPGVVAGWNAHLSRFEAPA